MTNPNSSRTTTSFYIVRDPDLRILLRCICCKYGCKAELTKSDRITVSGFSSDLILVRNVFNELRSKLMLRRAVVSARFPNKNFKYVEAEFMKGFVQVMCRYLNSEHRVIQFPPNEFNLLGELFADELGGSYNG